MHPHRHGRHHASFLPGANFSRQILRRCHPCGLHQPYQRRPYLLSLFFCLSPGTGFFSFPRRRPGPSGIQYVSSLSALCGQLDGGQALHLHLALSDAALTILSYHRMCPVASQRTGLFSCRAMHHCAEGPTWDAPWCRQQASHLYVPYSSHGTALPTAPRLPFRHTCMKWWALL